MEKILNVENCTRCGKHFEKGEVRFPFPEQEVLCKKCHFEALRKGLERLNKVLASEKVGETRSGSETSKQVR